MKLARYGRSGAEKPGIIDAEGSGDVTCGGRAMGDFPRKADGWPHKLARPETMTATLAAVRERRQAPPNVLCQRSC